MSKYSKGPWSVDTPASSEGFLSEIIRDATGCQVALCGHWMVDESQANARLIAAAPELLAAVQAAECFISEFSGPKTDKLKGTIAAAIAKATGE